MRKLFRIVTPVLVPVGLFLAFGGDPTGAKEGRRPATTYECRWTDTHIVIDGTADDEAWKHAMATDSFRLPWLGKGDRPAKQATRAKLLWDREYLYFVAEMEDRDVFAGVTEHGGPTDTNDVFELFFRPSKSHAGYFAFKVNDANAVLDAFFPKWDPGAMNGTSGTAISTWKPR